MSAIDDAFATLCDAMMQQYPDDGFFCLIHGENIGLALTAEASFLSLACVIVVFSLIIRNILRYRRVLPNGDWKLLQVPADVYMLFLFIFDIVQALGGILDVRWVQMEAVIYGPYCTAQGIVQAIGQLGEALITIILAVHTFVTALWRVGIQARGFAFGLVGLACVFIVLWIGIAIDLDKNHGNTSAFWCSIDNLYNPEGVVVFWLWFALFASAIMYIPLYFWAEGRLSVDKEKWYKFRTYRADVEYSQRRAALRLLLYPLAYSLVVLPVTAVDWLWNRGIFVPFVARYLAVSMRQLAGAINVFLFLVVRPQLLLFTPPEETIQPELEFARRSMSSAILPDTAAYNHSLQAAGKGVAGGSGERSGNSATLSRVSYRERSMDSDI